VIGKAADVAKTTGKVILQKDGALFLNPNSKKKKQIYYPTLSKAKRTTPTLVLKRKLKHKSVQRRPYYVPWKPQENRWTMKIYAN
jgi:hypothetical protein